MADVNCCRRCGQISKLQPVLEVRGASVFSQGASQRDNRKPYPYRVNLGEFMEATIRPEIPPEAFYGIQERDDGLRDLPEQIQRM